MVCPVEELHVQVFFQCIHLFDDRSRGNKEFFGGFSKAAAVRSTYKTGQQGIYREALLWLVERQ
jgi:hypothetical protein